MTMKTAACLVMLLGYAYASNDKETPCLQNEIICEDSGILNLSCYPNVIYVINGYYGRQNIFRCEFFPQLQDDCYTGTKKIIQECHCQTQCTIEASEDYFEKDPCFWASEYLNVTYTCITSNMSECKNIPTDKDFCTDPTASSSSPSQSTLLATTLESQPTSNPIVNTSPLTTTNLSSTLSEKIKTALSVSTHYSEAETRSLGISASTITHFSIENITTAMKSSENSASDLTNQLSTLDWVGIAIGLLTFLILIVVGAFVYVSKRHQRIKGTHGDVMSKDDWQSSKMEPENIKPSNTDSTCGKMTVNILYDSYQPKHNESNENNDTLSNECIYAKPNKKKEKSENALAEQNNAVYDFAENE